MPTVASKIANPTKNDLAEEVRETIVGLLQGSLADSADLQLQAKTAHWNVKGPNFIALHELFDQLHGETLTWTDDIAERLVQLGGVAAGTVQQTAANTTLPEYPLEIKDGADHVERLSSSLAAYGKTIRAKIDKADQAGDMDTADLFTSISRAVDKMLWFIESHNQ